mmetsp:Transcript_16686/g.24451  ORF Transcript_16686/g.24451 Transcript_16686/m.24451 type:complete len:279 (+) Transcript_16686:154-990(+)
MCQISHVIIFVLFGYSNIQFASSTMSNHYQSISKPLAFAISKSSARIKSTNRNPFRIATRLLGVKRGTPGAPPGDIAVYNHQTTIPDIDIPKLKETIHTIRDIIGYPTYDVSLIINEDEDMRETNLETRGVDKPTDILSFPFDEHEEGQPGILKEPTFDLPDYYNLGDMMVDVPYVIRRCEEDKEFYESDEEEMDIEVDPFEDYVGDDERGVSGVMATIYDPQQRIQLLLVHGMLHLVGYDHIEDDEYEVMVQKEEDVIKELQKRLNEDWCDVADDSE